MTAHRRNDAAAPRAYGDSPRRRWIALLSPWAGEIALLLGRCVAFVGCVALLGLALWMMLGGAYVFGGAP